MFLRIIILLIIFLISFSNILYNNSDSEEEYPKNQYVHKKSFKKDAKPKTIQPNPKNIQNFTEFNNEDLCKMAFNLAKDQAGCRFLQKRIEESSSLADDIFLNVSNLLNQVMNNIIDLSIDTFGNYLIQKLIEFTNKENIQYISEIVNKFLIRFMIISIKQV